MDGDVLIATKMEPDGQCINEKCRRDMGAGGDGLNDGPFHGSYGGLIDVEMIDVRMVDDANAIPAVLYDPGKGLGKLRLGQKLRVFNESGCFLRVKDDGCRDHGTGQTAPTYLINSQNNLMRLPGG